MTRGMMIRKFKIQTEAKKNQLKTVKSKFLLLTFVSMLVWVSGCNKSSDDSGSGSDPSSCPAIDGTSWTPEISGVSSSNHDSTSSLSSQTFTESGSVVGLAESWTSSNLTTFTFTVDSNLGTDSSITLVAEMASFPSSLEGSAYPALISLTDSNGTEWIQLDSSCQTGIFACSNQSCTNRVSCAPNTNSVFTGASAIGRQRHWSQFQFGLTAGSSTNSFPNCDWTDSTLPCRFTSAILQSGKLPSGTYTAKYLMVAENYSQFTSGPYSGSMKLTVLSKGDSNQSQQAIDLNVVLVGDQNIKDSRTDAGKRNLNSLFKHVYDHYYTQNTSSMNVKVGTITVYEWGCSNNGDAWANPSVDDIGELLKTGSNIVSSDSQTKAINVFLVSKLTSSGSQTILGVAGAIGGPPLNGTPASGVIFSSNDELATFNPECTTSPCPINTQESSFIDMGSTVSHELGHYLGLWHPTESAGSKHDFVPDTPQCSVTSSDLITRNSCRTETACSAVCSATQLNSYSCGSESACQFNHVMWWSAKAYNSAGVGDGNIFSTQSGRKVNYNALVR